MISKKKNKSYDEDFKKSSVELYFKTDKKQSEFARDIGVIPDTFRNWLDKYRDLYEPEPGNDREKTDYYRRKLLEAQMENDLLKKTIAIFSKSQI